MRNSRSLLAIFYAALRQPLSPQWAQLQRRWLSIREYWEQSAVHRELLRARLALFLVLTLGGCALAGHMLGVGTNAIMEFLILSGTAGACLSTWLLTRRRKFEMLAAVLQRFRIVMRAIDDAIQSTAHVVVATSEYARFVLLLARCTARFAAAAVRAHVGTCALVLTPRISAAPRFAAHIPAA